MIGDGYFFQHHAVSFRHLVEHIEHGAVILNGHDGFVAGLPGLSGDDEIKRFGGVARNDQFVGSASGDGGEFGRHFLFVGPLNGTHVIGALVVDVANVLDVSFERGLWDKIVVPVLEVDVIRLE